MYILNYSLKKYLTWENKVVSNLSFTVSQSFTSYILLVITCVKETMSSPHQTDLLCRVGSSLQLGPVKIDSRLINAFCKEISGMYYENVPYL